MTQLGFIILRHVTDEATNQYWQHCYDCIRKHYPDNHIMIIDDNSKEGVVTTDKQLHNVMLIQSEYPQRGELLPYIYFLQHKLFDIACIIHDSVFIQHPVDFLGNGFDKFRFIWHIKHMWDNVGLEVKNLHVFQNPDLIQFYHDKYKWKGCFGAMCIISHDYLTYVNSQTPFHLLLDNMRTRKDRETFERILACLLTKYHNDQPSLLGDIHEYMQWGIDISRKDMYAHLPILKVWTGR